LTASKRGKKATAKQLTLSQLSFLYVAEAYDELFGPLAMTKPVYDKELSEHLLM